MINPNDVTIIIPHLGGSKESEFALDHCIPSLRETIPTAKVIIAFNGRNCLGGHNWDDISIIHLNEQGQNKAVNAAVATTNTPWIFITNDDMVYAPGWFEKLIQPLGKKYIVNKEEISELDLVLNLGEFIPMRDINAVKEIPEILCISPKLIEPRPGAPTFEVYFCGGAGGDFDKQKWLEYEARREIKTTDLAVRSGFNFPVLINREAFDLVGGYDIQYDPWGASGDTDLQCKLELAGVKTYQNTNCLVYHFSQTSGTFEPRNQGDWAKNYAYFQEKWGFERPGDPDVWFSRNLIKYDQLKYHPWWKDFYNKKTSEDKAKMP